MEREAGNTRSEANEGWTMGDTEGWELGLHLCQIEALFK